MSDVEKKRLTGDRLIYDDPAGYSVIVPEDAVKSVPLSCDVCGYLFRTLDDERSWREFQCCSACATKWAYHRKADWSAGWRPPPDDVRTFVEQRSLFELNVDA